MHTTNQPARQRAQSSNLFLEPDLRCRGAGLPKPFANQTRLFADSRHKRQHRRSLLSRALSLGKKTTRATQRPSVWNFCQCSLAACLQLRGAEWCLAGPSQLGHHYEQVKNVTRSFHFALLEWCISSFDTCWIFLARLYCSSRIRLSCESSVTTKCRKTSNPMLPTAGPGPGFASLKRTSSGSSL